MPKTTLFPCLQGKTSHPLTQPGHSRYADRTTSICGYPHRLLADIFS